jgi:RHS repeat-associated protein
MPPLLPFYFLCNINHFEIMGMLRNYYHPDQASMELNTSLGSSNASTELSNHWITDRNGNAIQHLHYLPFGEDWVDQRNSSWNTPYTFSGKEKDVETGYSYFGARYYDSGLSIWLSVDPMSDKYPSMSPYNYCANNPVILVDPDGRTFKERQAAIAEILSYNGTPYSKKDCSTTVNDAIKNSTDIGSLITGKGMTDQSGTWTNGVAQIVANCRPVNKDDMVAGNLVTFKTDRTTQKGKDGQFDHIGMITNINLDDNGKISSFDFVHSTNKEGVHTSTYDMENGLDGFELKGIFAWDSPSAKLPEVTVKGKVDFIVKPILKTLLNSEPIN